MRKQNRKGPKKKTKQKSDRVAAVALPQIRPKVSGIDLGSRERWVCAPAESKEKSNVHTFGTTMPQLRKLANWLQAHRVESVTMESTNVYCIPIYELLESCGIEVLLVNASQVHNVPGRKTGMKDCQWIQRLHSCGLLRGSFRPEEAIAGLRARRRQLGNLVAVRTRYVQWMQKALDQMNVQVHRAVSDLTGRTGMAIIRAIVAGERDPVHLAALRHGLCRKSREEFAEYLDGNWREEHLFDLASALTLYDGIEERIVAYETRILEEIRALQPEERREEPVPPHPNGVKKSPIRGQGQPQVRTDLWRFAGVDLTPDRRHRPLGSSIRPRLPQEKRRASLSVWMPLRHTSGLSPPVLPHGAVPRLRSPYDGPTTVPFWPRTESGAATVALRAPSAPPDSSFVPLDIS